MTIKALFPGELARDVNIVFREAQALSELQHPAFVKVWHWDFFDHDKTRPFIVMEHFAGGNLQSYLDQHGVLLPADLLMVARQIATAMPHAHQREIFHRDLKPDNLLVHKTETGWDVKVIDFGLAIRAQTIRASLEKRSSQRSLLDVSIAGTVEYAAPEQLGNLPGVKIGAYSDVYAFGNTCYQALFGTTRPRRKDFNKLAKEFEPLADLLDRCLNREPKDRPADFTVVLKDLDTLAASLSPRTAAQKQNAEEDLARLQAEGEPKLRQVLRHIFDRTHGKPTKQDGAPASTLMKEYKIPKERADAIGAAKSTFGEF